MRTLDEVLAMEAPHDRHTAVREGAPDEIERRVTTILSAAAHRTTQKFCCGCGWVGREEGDGWHTGTQAAHARDESCVRGHCDNCPVPEPFQCGPMVPIAAILTQEELDVILARRASRPTGAPPNTYDLMTARESLARIRLFFDEAQSGVFDLGSVSDEAHAVRCELDLVADRVERLAASAPPLSGPSDDGARLDWLERSPATREALKASRFATLREVIDAARSSTGESRP